MSSMRQDTESLEGSKSLSKQERRFSAFAPMIEISELINLLSRLIALSYPTTNNYYLINSICIYNCRRIRRKSKCLNEEWEAQIFMRRNY